MFAEEYFFEIKKRFGSIKRARGCFLYTEKGVRLTDMYLENGRAILGWGNANGQTGSNAFLKFKNIINRGLTGSFETDFSLQLDKAVSDLLNTKCKAYIFFDIEKLKKVALSISSKFITYTPWQGLTCENNLVKDFECVMIIPPFAWTNNIYILAMHYDITPLFFADNVSGALKGALARGIYDLITEIPQRTEKDWFLYDTILTKYFVRKGPYLYPKVDKDKYDDFVKHCFECNLLISPDYNIASIVPYKIDKGNFSLLKKSNWGSF